MDGEEEETRKTEALHLKNGFIRPGGEGLEEKGWKGLQCVIMTRISVHISSNIYNV